VHGVAVACARSDKQNDFFPNIPRRFTGAFDAEIPIGQSAERCRLSQPLPTPFLDEIAWIQRERGGDGDSPIFPERANKFWWLPDRCFIGHLCWRPVVPWNAVTLLGHAHFRIVLLEPDLAWGPMGNCWISNDEIIDENKGLTQLYKTG